MYRTLRDNISLMYMLLASGVRGLSLLIASVYGGGTYNSSTYNGSSTTGSSGLLTDTGFDLAVVITIACVITLIAIAVRIWRKPSRKSTTPVE